MTLPEREPEEEACERRRPLKKPARRLESEGEALRRSEWLVTERLVPELVARGVLRGALREAVPREPVPREVLLAAAVDLPFEDVRAVLV